MKKVGLVVMAEDSLLNGSGFAPRYQILDGLRKASYNIEKKEIRYLKKIICLILLTRFVKKFSGFYYF
jgi:hypothetical protein